MPTDRKAGGDFGTRLREARERKGVSLRQIAESTRISVRILEALEHNDISHLPGGIFSRAFVRSYAIAVGLDPEATVDDFVQLFPNDSVTAGHSAAARLQETDTFESDRRMATVVVRLALVSVPIAGALLYFGMSGRPTRDRGPATPPTAQPSAAPTAGVERQASTREGRLVLEVIARRSVTVSTTVDGGPDAAVDLAAGERRSFEATREISLAVSDAAAIDWTVNGTAGRELGLAGDRAAVHLTLDNYQSYLSLR